MQLVELRHFGKARAMAEWIMARRNASLAYGERDPRYGIPPGVDEGDDFKVQYMHQTPQSQCGHRRPPDRGSARVPRTRGRTRGRGKGRVDARA